MQSLIDEL